MNSTKLINCIIESIISVMGEDKWNNMTAEQQHDAIMLIVKDLNNRI